MGLSELLMFQLLTSPHILSEVISNECYMPYIVKILVWLIFIRRNWSTHFYYKINIITWIWINEHLYLARIKTWQIISHLPETDPEQRSLQKWLLQPEIECLKVIQASVRRRILLFLANNRGLEVILSWSFYFTSQREAI